MFTAHSVPLPGTFFIFLDRRADSTILLMDPDKIAELGPEERADILTRLLADILAGEHRRLRLVA